MSDPVTRLNAALEGRYSIERELGEGGMARKPRRVSQRAFLPRIVPTSVPIKEKAPVENSQEPLSFLVPRQGRVLPRSDQFRGVWGPGWGPITFRKLDDRSLRALSPGKQSQQQPKCQPAFISSNVHQIR